MKATSAILSNPRFALAGRHSSTGSVGVAAGKAFSSRFSQSIKSWTDVQDELKDLQHMMTEHQTNRAVPKLDDSNIVQQVHDLINTTSNNGIDHNEAFQRAHQLKALVKHALYYHPNHSHSSDSSSVTGTGQGRRMMSTMAHTASPMKTKNNKNKWADIDNEIDQLHHIMEEHKTNHSVACPQKQLEDMVRSNMDEIFQLQSTASDDWVTHDEAIRRVRLLKNLVKAELYRKDATAA